MGFSRADTRLAYTIEPGLDPETGEPVFNLRSKMTGGHIVSIHATRQEAETEAARLAAGWDALQ